MVAWVSETSKQWKRSTTRVIKGQKMQSQNKLSPPMPCGRAAHFQGALSRMTCVPKAVCEAVSARAGENTVAVFWLFDAVFAISPYSILRPNKLENPIFSWFSVIAQGCQRHPSIIIITINCTGHIILMISKKILLYQKKIRSDVGLGKWETRLNDQTGAGSQLFRYCPLINIPYGPRLRLIYN